MKTCTKCGEGKPLAAFRERIKRGGPYRLALCRSCETKDRAARKGAVDAEYMKKYLRARRARAGAVVAENHRKEWTDKELVVALSRDFTDFEAAALLGRSPSAVQGARQRAGRLRAKGASS